MKSIFSARLAHGSADQALSSTLLLAHSFHCVIIVMGGFVGGVLDAWLFLGVGLAGQVAKVQERCFR
jgi:hypothetical protein